MLPAATYERTITFPDATVRFHSRSFVVDAPAAAVDLSNLLADEWAISRDHRWCTPAEIAQSDETFVPPGLPQLLRSIIAGTHPRELIVLRYDPGVRLAEIDPNRKL